MKVKNQLSLLCFMALCLSTQIAFSAQTELVSISSGGVQANEESANLDISDDGRFIAFRSNATNLVANGANFVSEIYLHDRITHSTTHVSVDSAGNPLGSLSDFPVISGNGRHVAFHSIGTSVSIFVHDRITHQTSRPDVSSAGIKSNNSSWYPSLSADGRYVAYVSAASNLVLNDTNSKNDIFVRDRVAHKTIRVSVASNGKQGNGDSFGPRISANGRYIVFASLASNLVIGDSNKVSDVFVHDLVTHKTLRISTHSSGMQANAQSIANAISGDGHYVTFNSWATNLTSNDANDSEDIFVHDLLTHKTSLISKDFFGNPGNSFSFDSDISNDGRYVTFVSNSSNLVTKDTNGWSDVLVYDRLTGKTTLASLNTSGKQANADSFTPKINANGHYVVFQSGANNLMPNDTNLTSDIFVRTR